MTALLILVPFGAVVLLNLLTHRAGTRLALAFAGALAAAQVVAALAVPAATWARPGPTLLDPARLLAAPLPLDGLGRVMILAIGLVSLSAVSIARYVRTSRDDAYRFGNLLLLALAAMNGLVLARDLFTLYVFLEITAVAALVLIALERGIEAFEGAFKYLVLSTVATALMLCGVALLLIVSGGTSFEVVAAGLRAASTSHLAGVAVALFLAGLGIKAGLVPFHGWLPDAYASAPAPVSVLLAGIVTKTTGVYTLIRLVDAVFGYGRPIRLVLLVLGLASVLGGAIAAIGQRDLKRLLAYSSVSQMGYVALGLAAGPGLGLAGAVFHLFNHALFKAQLFVNSAAVEREAGTRDLEALGALGGAMPVTGATSVVALLSAAGIPPAAGFWSKLLIVIALWKAGHPAVAAAAIVGSVLTLAYLLRMQRRVFLAPPPAPLPAVREAGAFGLAPALLLAGLTLGLGLAAPWLFDTFLLPVGSIL